MRSAFAILLVAGIARANEPPIPSADDEWIDAINAAHTQLDACARLGDSLKLYGDVVVKYERKARRWTRTASRSLDALGEKAAACVQDAIARHYHDVSYASSFDNTLEHTQTIGTPKIMLPPIDKLLPAWRAHDRKALARLVPRDYTVTAEGCLKTDRESIENVEFLWLPSTGTYVPRIWTKPLGVTVAMYRGGGELVTQGRRGLCLEHVDQPKLRAEMAKAGSCWAGSFEDVLLQPHLALPADVAQVSTEHDAICTLSTAGEITCCGRPLPAPPKGPFTQVAAGGTFACALDAKGNPTCWGAIGAPPSGPFTKISAEYSHACGVRPSGELECWGSGTYGVAVPPAGAFTDVAAAQFSTCGVKNDGSVQCWGEPSRAAHPPGTFVQIAADWTHACGVRTDGTVGCWRDEGGAVDTPLTGEFVQVAVGDSSHVCGRRKDGTIVCAGSHPTQPGAPLTQPPAGTFVQLAGDHDTFCAVSADHHVTCWGDLWPGAYAGETTYPWLKVMGLAPKPPPPPATPPGMLSLTGRIVDENGKPIAGAEVLACGDTGPCIWAAKRAVAEPGTLAQLGKGGVSATTAGDGTYRAVVPKPKGWGDRIEVVVTAPGREVVERESSDPAQLTGDIALRPASSVDIALSCDGKPCTGVLRVELSQYHWYEGTHLEKLPPGTHTIEAIDDFGKPGERSGTATITVTFAGGAQHVTVAAKPVGTGKTIRGHAPGGTHLYAKCGTGRTIYREATADNSTGEFELDDVGPLPCEVEASKGESIARVKVDKLPADIKIKLRDEDPDGIP